jgi:CHAT domain-containing protein
MIKNYFYSNTIAPFILQRTTLFFFYFVISFGLPAQNLATSYFEQGDELISQRSYSEAVVRFDLALKGFQKLNNWDSVNISLNSIAYCFNFMKQYGSTVDRIDAAIPVLNRQGHSNSFYLAKSWLLRGYAMRWLENYSEALKSYEMAISIYEALKSNDPNVAYAYRNAAQILMRKLDYPKTVAYLKKALVVDSTNIYLPSILGQLANTYSFLNEQDSVLYYYQKIISIGADGENLASIQAIAANAFLSKNDYPAAEKLLFASLSFYNVEPDYWLETLKRYIGLAELSKRKNELSKAHKFVQLGIKLVNKQAKVKNREVGRLNSWAGDFFITQNLLDSALAHYQQALIQVFPKFNSTNIADNPDIKDVYTESWIMTAAARKAQALHLRYQQKGDIADLRNAAYCFDLSLAGVKQLHKSYGSDGAKLYMGDYSHGYWEEAIEVNYLLYTKTGEQAYLRKIFSLMEQSKASVLSDAIQKNKALLLTGIPDSLLELEKDLRISIAEYTTQLKNTEVEGQGSGEEVLAKINAQLSDYRLRHERLLEQMKADYPNFRAYIEEYPEPNFEDVLGKILDDKSIFVEFFTGGKAIYCLTIGRNGAAILKLERNDDLECRLQEYFSFFKNSNAILDDPAGYLTTAHSLYRSLFSNTLSNANAGIQRLVLVPDGLLGYLPFDALVTQEPSSFKGFGNIEFLVKKYSLSYAYSANTLLQQKDLHQRKGKLLRVMPRFLDGERGLAPLRYSDEETTDGIAWLSLEGGQATKAGFKSLAETCRLLHLSTHAESNAGSGEPYIELADGQLLLPELYAMNLSAADLVVLSACETGLGEVAKGEGVMSLARGFAYAGAGSLVASLWKVNERSTASLFAHFYQYLAEGKTKSEALRLAKLSLLEHAGTDTRQSPYYWAGFVFMGNDGGMDLPSNKQNLLLGIGGAGLAAGAIVYLRKRRRKLIA